MLQEMTMNEMQDANGGGVAGTLIVVAGMGKGVFDGASRIGEDKSVGSNVLGCVEIGAAVVFGTAALVGVNILPTP
jgi:hypothetical protein